MKRSCGYNGAFQCGAYHNEVIRTLSPVEKLRGGKVLKIASSGFHTAAVLAKELIYGVH